MMTTSVERWHSETSSFHFPTSEATITLEDVWRILQFKIHSDHVIYDVDVGGDTFFEIMEVKELTLSKGQINLEYYRGRVPTFQLIIMEIICGLVAQDWQGRYFSLGWGLAWEQIL